MDSGVTHAVFKEIESLFGIDVRSFACVPVESIARSAFPAIALNSEGKLIGLSLARVKFQKFPQYTDIFNCLSILQLNECGLASLPEDIAEMKSLTGLYLGDNQNIFIPNSIAELTSLKRLSLNRIGVSEIPKAIFGLKSIQVLGVSANRLTSISDGFCELHSLQNLYARSNAIESVASSLFELPKLELLDLDGNRLLSRLNIPANTAGLAHINLRRTGFREFPSDLLNLKALTSLNLSETKVSTLPQKIVKSNTLKSLSLRGCGLFEFPNSITAIRNLEYLDVSDNPIRSLGNNFSKLRKLKSFRAVGCKIQSLPEDIGKMENAEFLDIRGNRIEELPTSILTLRVPIMLGRPLTEEPNADEFIAKEDSENDGGIMGIYVSGNPLRTPPFEVINSGEQAVRSYLQSLSGKRSPVNEVKVLFVGDGGCGKTSLTKIVLGQSFDPNESQTHGINISKLTFPQKNRTFTSHLWDFGGQEIMHATHQFFLSRRSIYVVVLDGRREEKTEYWLKHVEAFGGDSPIIVVLNKIDENPAFEVNRRFLKEKYPSIRLFVRVSCSTGDGVDEVISALKRECETVESAQTIWPQTWFEVKQALEGVNDDYISISQFKKICVKHNLQYKDHQSTLLAFLHDLGVVLNFQDLPLRDTNVINPAWVTDGVYKIVNSPKVIQAGGIFRASELSEILDATTYPAEKHYFLIELMKKFELCYYVGADEFLLPSLLPVEEPSLPAFKAIDTIQYSIQYDFLPKSIIPRFIVRMHNDIVDEKRWRTGVLLHDSFFGCKALVLADEEDSKVQVSIEGGLRREYLALIAQSIRDINRSFSGIHFEERISLPDDPKISVSYSHLLTLKRNGTHEFIPEGAAKNYSVEALLGEVIPSEKFSEEQILHVLEKMYRHGDNEKTLMQKSNEALMVKPNFFGVGVDLNAVIRLFLKNKKSKA